MDPGVQRYTTKDWGIMDRTVGALIALLIIVFIVLAGPFVSSGIQERMYTSSRESTLSFVINLTTNGTLRDPELFLPLPASAVGSSPLLDPIGNGTVIQEPAIWNYTVFGANNETMLKFWTEGSLLLAPGIQSVTTTFSVMADSPPLHTGDPIRYDYTLLPKRAVQEIPCPEDAEQCICFAYETLAYASYDSSADTVVRIESTLAASNRWQVFGEHENRYQDRLTATFQGPARGWHMINGILIASCGEETPFWRGEQEESGFVIPSKVNATRMKWHVVTSLP